MKYTCSKCNALPVDKPEWIRHADECPENPNNYGKRFYDLEERIKKLEEKIK